MEEFRQQVVDRTVFSMINQGTSLEIEEGKLSDDTRKKLRDKIYQRLETYVYYEIKKHRLRVVIQRQARHIATFLRGEREYKPFIGTW